MADDTANTATEEPVALEFNLTEALGALKAGWPLNFGDVKLTHCRIEGRPFQFATFMERDPIQKAHRKGRFYEAEELEIMRAVFPSGGTFVDIGANVGNHSIFAACFMNASRVIPVEPNPLALRMLVANVLLNRLEDVIDLSRLGVGLSDRDGSGFSMEARNRNIGAARLLPAGGNIVVTTGDRILGDVTPDLVKIDVECMEIEVLAGLEATIARSRPMLFVEVDNTNNEAFMAWAAKMNYRVKQEYCRYAGNMNYLMLPGTRAGEAEE